MASNTGETKVVTSGGGASWFLVGILLAVVVGGAFLYFGGYIGGDSVDISVEIPGSD